jgi:phosphate transport system permease protein
MRIIKNDQARFEYFKKELAGKSVVTVVGFFLIVITLSIVGFILYRGSFTFLKDGISPLKFLFTTTWDPERAVADGGPAVGSLIFLVGSIAVSLLALLISLPFCMSTAIFISEISPSVGKKFLQPAIEIFVGIPSVVYGWIGLSVLVPFLRHVFGGLGFSLLAGGIILAIMIFPTITTISADALSALPHEYKEASIALGATRWTTIRKVLIPGALPGMMTGVVFGLARAFGEALAVQMVIGNMITLPRGITKPMINLTSIITLDMGNTVDGSLWNDALWSMAVLLLVISFAFILLVNAISRKGAQL